MAEPPVDITYVSTIVEDENGQSNYLTVHNGQAYVGKDQLSKSAFLAIKQPYLTAQNNKTTWHLQGHHPNTCYDSLTILHYSHLLGARCRSTSMAPHERLFSKTCIYSITHPRDSGFSADCCGTSPHAIAQRQSSSPRSSLYSGSSQCQAGRFEDSSTPTRLVRCRESEKKKQGVSPHGFA